MRKQWTMIIALVIIILIAIFSVINVDPVEVNYLFGSSEWPLILVILFSVLLGGIMMVSVSMYVNHQLKQENKKLQKQLEEAVSKKAPKHISERDKKMKEDVSKAEVKPKETVEDINSQK